MTSIKGRILGAISVRSAIKRCFVDLRLAESSAQCVVVHEDAVDLRTKRVEILQILHADGATPDLVLVGGPDAASGRADLAFAGGCLAHDVQFAVQRQDQRRILGDAQVFRRDGHALLPQPLDLRSQRPWIDDDAVADDGELAGRTTPDGSSESL